MAIVTDSSLAFIVLAHTDSEQVERLLQALPAESSKILFVDGKSRSLASYSTTVRNVQFITPTFRTYWGAFSLVEASLSGLRTGLSIARAQRFILLSGQCYPLRSNADIVSFFQRHCETEFIKYFDIRASNKHYLRKLEAYYLSEDVFSGLSGGSSFAAKAASRLATAALWPVKRNWRRSLGRFVPAFGSQWWAVTRPCAQMIVEVAEDPALRFFRQTFAPDEMFFHTIVANSVFHTRAGGFQPFVGRGNRRLANLHMLSTSSLRRIFTLKDWDEVRKSTQLFLRKVNSAESTALIDRIERELRTRNCDRLR